MAYYTITRRVDEVPNEDGRYEWQVRVERNGLRLMHDVCGTSATPELAEREAQRLYDRYRRMFHIEGEIA